MSRRAKTIFIHNSKTILIILCPNGRNIIQTLAWIKIYIYIPKSGWPNCVCLCAMCGVCF